MSQAKMDIKEDKSEGDQLIKVVERLTLEEEEAITSTQESVSMRNMHFTNGDWYPKERPKPQASATSEEQFTSLPGKQEKIALDEIATELMSEADDSPKEEDEKDDENDLEKYKDEETGEIPQSFFEVLCRECSKIPYTPEEQQERRNEGHKERNKMLLDGIKSNHREWIYQIEEKLALEMMNQKRKALKRARKEKRLAAIEQDFLQQQSTT